VLCTAVGIQTQHTNSFHRSKGQPIALPLHHALYFFLYFQLHLQSLRAVEAVEKPLSLWNFTEEENMIRETVAKFAQDVILPRARDMDEKEVMDKVCPYNRSR
jgi:hypothetical protein